MYASTTWSGSHAPGAEARYSWSPRNVAWNEYEPAASGPCGNPVASRCAIASTPVAVNGLVVVEAAAAPEQSMVWKKSILTLFTFWSVNAGGGVGLAR